MIRSSFPTLPLTRLRRMVWRAGVPERHVEDVAQEVLIRLWKCGVSLEAREKPAAWLRQVVMNAARDFLRSAAVRREVLLVEGEIEIMDERPDPEEHIFALELIVLVHHLAERLCSTRRQVLVDHEVIDKTLPQIAAEQRIPLETAKDRLHSAKQEFSSAAKRWDLSRDRGRRWAKLVALLPPWPSVSALFGPGVKIAAVAGVTALVAAADVLPLRGTRHLPDLPAAAAPTPAPLALPARNSSPPEEAEIIEARPAPSARPRRPSPREEDLIGRASAALQAGDALDARRLLDDHEREYPRGPLAPERRRLRRRLP